MSKKIRLEFSLRDSSTHEKEFADRLEEEAETFGGKNLLLRECLARGSEVLAKVLRGEPHPSWDQARQSGYLGFRVLTTFVERESVIQGAQFVETTPVHTGNMVKPIDNTKSRSTTSSSVLPSEPNGETDNSTVSIPNWGAFRSLVGKGSNG